MNKELTFPEKKGEANVLSLDRSVSPRGEGEQTHTHILSHNLKFLNLIFNIGS